MMIRNHLKSLQQVRSKLQWLHYNPQQWHLVWDTFLPGMHSSFFTQGKVTDVARGVDQQLKLWQYYSEKKHNRTFSSRSHCPGYSKIPHSSDRTSIVADEGNTSTQQRINEQQQQTLAKVTLAKLPVTSTSLKYMALKNFSSWHFKCIISGVSSQGKAFHSVLFFQKHLGYGGLTVFLHFKGFVVSVPLHLGKDEPFPKHWLIRQRESHIDNAWKRKQHTVNSATVQPLPSLTEHNSAEAEAKHSTQRKK